MANTESHLTLMILVDALRADYVSQTTYLKRLSANSATGCLRECFGFLPRAAYFGGLNAEQSGFTSSFCWDPERSPFKIARYLVEQPGITPQAQLADPRSYVEKRASERLSPFANAQLTTGGIPLEYLPCFDLAEKRAPWDRDVGYESLFALLEKHGFAWYECSWPLTNHLPDHSDAALVARTLKDLQPRHRFAFLHLQELDGVGHSYGPGSLEIQEQLLVVDKLCENLIESLRERYQVLDVVLFGDHGMVTVTGTVDVWSLLTKTTLRFGIDYGFFLDSTMARFWFLHARARRIVEEALRQVPGGRLLSAEDMVRYQIAKCDPRNGELFFLADPGVVVFPNFFQQAGNPIKGMHGYDPDCTDNLGFFLVHSPRESEWAGRELGPVDPPALFGLSCHLVGIEESRKATSPLPLLPKRHHGRYTSHPDPAADQMVEGQLGRIVEAISQRCGKPQAVVLMGSFGRGKGGVYLDGNGRFRPVNDYDIIVVTPQACDTVLAALGGELAKELGLDYVDLARSTPEGWTQLPASVLHFDLKYGSQVIFGDSSLLDRIPLYCAAQIPVSEATKLLLNRSAGLLTGLRKEYLGEGLPKDEPQRYLTNQVAKALMALGDSHLIRWGEYSSSYSARAERLRWLGPGVGLQPALLDLLLRAYQFKLLPDYEAASWGAQEISCCYPAVTKALIDAINLEFGTTTTTIYDAMTCYVKGMSANKSRTERENASCVNHPDLRPILLPRVPTDLAIRHVVYSALPFLVLASIENTAVALEEARRRLASIFALPPFTGTREENWEKLRELAVKAWFAVCH